MSRSRFEQLTTPHRRDGEESGFLWTWLYLGFALVVALFLVQSLSLKHGSATPVASASSQPSATPRPTPSPALPTLPANLEQQLKQNFKQLKWPVAAANLKSTPQTLTWRVPATELFAWDLRTLSPRSQAFFRTLASQLKTWNLALQIEGAGLPARSGNLRWVSDWELSALQAARIADFLMTSQAPAERLQVLAGKAPQAGKAQSLGTLQLHFLALPAPSPSPTPLFSATPVAQRGQVSPALTRGAASPSSKAPVGGRPSALPPSSPPSALPLSRRSSNR
ncbi:MAG: hypothetical protein IV090_09490 [Candidatus Sericytochromatia bacterium]|nr:hypothetical protein [Candidatus Sericytochromatia bacterium]